MTKSELRKIFLAKRKRLSTAQREARSSAIVSRFFNGFDLTGIKVLHCYVPIERLAEIDTRAIFQRVWSEYPAVETVVPRVDHETQEIESLVYGSDVELVLNKWEIGEPSHDRRVKPQAVDMVLVPLVCFDRSGHRVGYGKGFYDRFLRKCRSDCVKIGLSYFQPVDEISGTHDGDITLDYAITTNRTFDLRG
jgi:5-formyltetrahydrofolate cyclo-ligase